MSVVWFLFWKLAIFCKVKEIKRLSGGVVLYAAQSKVQIDAEIAEKGGFRTEMIKKACRQPYPKPKQHLNHSNHRLLFQFY